MSRLTGPLACVLLCAVAVGPAAAAVKYERFPHCPDGLVSKKTCECHRGTSGRYRFCHAGDYCDTDKGKCHKQERND